jgi:hypothetical protein
VHLVDTELARNHHNLAGECLEKSPRACLADSTQGRGMNLSLKDRVTLGLRQHGRRHPLESSWARH